MPHHENNLLLMRFKIFNWNFAFYNARTHRPSWNLDDFDFFGINNDISCIAFAATDILGILQMVSNRMSNVVYHSEIEYLKVNKLFEFVQKNTLKILCKLFFDGYFVYDIKENRFADVDEDRINEYRKCENFVLFVDPFYRATNKTQKHALMPYIDMLDVVNNADLNLLKNYGAMGVLSPESSQFQDGVFDDKAREELQKDYNQSHGITFGKWALLITKKPVKFSPITLPIKELEIADKRKTAIAEILQFENIPKELHALFESAKYANRNEAELDMYGNKITATANMMLDFINKVYDRMKRKKINGQTIYLDNEFWFDIVNVPALQEAQRTEREAAREELRFWQEMKVAMPDNETEIEQRIEDLLNRI